MQLIGLIGKLTVSMMKKPSATAEARTAHRRAEWKIVVAGSFDEAEAETRAYWRSATPAERLNALEALREPFYNEDQKGGRLQRVLEVVTWDELLDERTKADVAGS